MIQIMKCTVKQYITFYKIGLTTNILNNLLKFKSIKFDFNPVWCKISKFRNSRWYLKLAFELLKLKVGRSSALNASIRHVARGGQGGSAAPRSKLVPLKKNQKIKPPCYCWQSVVSFEIGLQTAVFNNRFTWVINLIPYLYCQKSCTTPYFSKISPRKGCRPLTPLGAAPPHPCRSLLASSPRSNILATCLASIVFKIPADTSLGVYTCSYRKKNDRSIFWETF